MGTVMTISRVAKLAGVGVETVRYYQRRGLLAEPAKYGGAFRRYPIETVEQILFIKRAQALGFSLDEIGILMQSDTTAGCAPIHELVMQKAEALRSQINDLGGRLGMLERLVCLCGNWENELRSVCPLVAHLSGKGMPALDTEVNCIQLK